MPLNWLDLYCGDDPHARRFDRLELLLLYLRRVERLDPAALAEIEARGAVEPPLARRTYRIEPLSARPSAGEST